MIFILNKEDATCGQNTPNAVMDRRQLFESILRFEHKRGAQVVERDMGYDLTDMICAVPGRTVGIVILCG
eukprot:8892961-Pyramimonas_sp.AAC.1